MDTQVRSDRLRDAGASLRAYLGYLDVEPNKEVRTLAAALLKGTFPDASAAACSTALT